MKCKNCGETIMPVASNGWANDCGYCNGDCYVGDMRGRSMKKFLDIVRLATKDTKGD